MVAVSQSREMASWSSVGVTVELTVAVVAVVTVAVATVAVVTVAVVAVVMVVVVATAVVGDGEMLGPPQIA